MRCRTLLAALLAVPLLPNVCEAAEKDGGKKERPVTQKEMDAAVEGGLMVEASVGGQRFKYLPKK